MTLFLIVFFLLLLGGVAGFPKRLSVNTQGYLSPMTTASINGFFILLVFLRHLEQYVPEGLIGPFDKGNSVTQKFLGQLIVATFLFYSGYGIAESIKHKERYINHLPTRRIMPFLIDVWIALGAYLCIRIGQGKTPSVSRILLSMVGWESIGNSNWYIFAILACWLSTYLAFRLFPNDNKRWAAILLTLAFLLFYMVVMKRENPGLRFYNTVLCYPAGMILSFFSAIWKPAASGRYRIPITIASIIVFSAAFALVYGHRYDRALFYNLLSVLFCLIISMASILVSHASRPLVWLGQNLFFVYIYQRVPMILFRPLAQFGSIPYGVACLATTLLIGVLAKRLHTRCKLFLFENN